MTIKDVPGWVVVPVPVPAVVVVVVAVVAAGQHMAMVCTTAPDKVPEVLQLQHLTQQELVVVADS